jgi:hypothetical protein
MRSYAISETRFVYIASPYTKGVPNHNVHRAIKAGDALLAAGFVPFIPILNHLWDTVSPHDYEDWMKWDHAWIERCDALVRLSGESSGAERDRAIAASLGLHIYEDVESLIETVRAARARERR